MHSFLLKKKWSQLTRIYCLCICISHIFNALNRLIPIKLIALRSLWKQHVKLVMTWGFFISVGIKCSLMSRVIVIVIRGVMRQFFQPGQKVQENPSFFFLMEWGYQCRWFGALIHPMQITRITSLPVKLESSFWKKNITSNLIHRVNVSITHNTNNLIYYYCW